MGHAPSMAWAACAGIEHHITVITHEEMDKVLATNPDTC
jgi:hypothetical protein